MTAAELFSIVKDVDRQHWPERLVAKIGVMSMGWFDQITERQSNSVPDHHAELLFEAAFGRALMNAHSGKLHLEEWPPAGGDTEWRVICGPRVLKRGSEFKHTGMGSGSSRVAALAAALRALDAERTA